MFFLKKLVFSSVILSCLLAESVFGGTNIYYNDKKVNLNTIVVDDYSYVSLRDVAELFDLHVAYNELNGNVYLKPKLEYTPIIAHAGGEIRYIYGSNSKEAVVDSILEGNNIVELDFGFTTDNRLVAIHDFEDGLSKYFKTDYRPVTYDEFMELNFINNLTQLDIDGVISLFDTYPTLHIITDTKYDNIKMLTYIAENYPDYIKRFIPQIYTFDEYYKVANLGYENIIFTSYKAYIDNKTLLEFAKGKELFAITIPYERAQDGLAKGIYEKTGIPVYAHTVNDVEIYKGIKEKGIYGIYTDTLNVKDLK